MVVQLAKACAVLLLDGEFDQGDLKRAYRREMMKWHPDKHHGRETEQGALERSIKINAAYEWLSELLESSGGQLGAAARRAAPQHTTRHQYQGRSHTPGFPDSRAFEVFVRSSHIVSYGYVANDSVFYLKFAGGDIYRYFDVPRSLVEDFASADSHGSFAHQHIYRKYRSERC